MPDGLPNYASPMLRWGLLLEDHPGATVEYDVVLGEHEGIPPQFGGSNEFVRAVIHIPGLPDVAGCKEIPDTHVVKGKSQPFQRTSDNWQVLRTKALGRALKQAGYPDDLKDLKALMHWRERQAEVAAITAGYTPKQLEAGDKDQALTDAGKSDPEHADEDDDIEDAELVGWEDPDAHLEDPEPSLPGVA